MPKVAVPPHIVKVAQKLADAGFESVVVGGSVRDCLIGRPAKDWDLATNATPEQGAAVFPQTKATTRFGTALVPVRGELIEITTYRTEADYSDFRRPDRVDYTGDIRQDLARRDLTINAIAYNPISDELIDPFDGAADIGRKLLRAVGNPNERFSEDALRLLRVVRFAATLGFAIERATATAMRNNAHLASHLASERVGTEYIRLFAGPNRKEALRACLELGLIAPTLPEICEPKVQAHALACFLGLPDGATIPMYWAALFHHADGGSDAKRAASLARMRLGKLAIGDETALEVAHLIGIARLPEGGLRDSSALWRACRAYPRELFEQGMTIALSCERADTAVPKRAQDFLAAARMAYGDGLPGRITELAIGGDDLIRLGVKPGPPMGALLKDLLEATTEKLVPNEREALLRYIKSQMSV